LHPDPGSVLSISDTPPFLDHVPGEPSGALDIYPRIEVKEIERANSLPSFVEEQY
jgi:hypothetical protein